MIKLVINTFILTGFSVLSYASLPLPAVSPSLQISRLAGTANPLGQKKTYGYDKMSRVTELTDPAGNVTAYAYDALNRLTRREVRSPSGGRSVTDYSYDAVGNLLKAANGEGAVSYTYDALDRPVEAVQSFGGQAYAVSYAYDAVGNRTAMRTPWGGFTYTYDALNRLTGLVNPQGIAVNFKYDAAGRRIKKSVFKAAPLLLAETDYAYDAAGQLLSITNKAGGKVVAFSNYEYDLAGNRVLKKDQDGVTRYGYDKSNRLITVEPVPMVIPKAEAFIYDKNGNRRFDKGAKDYQYDAANRLRENTVYAYTHDANGNLTGRTHKADGTSVTYAYNLEQQLAEVVTPGHRLQYKYDPLGRRIGKSVDGSPTHYVYDNEDIIAMLDGEGKVLQTFTHGPGIDEPLIMTKTDGANYYYHADGLGSITVLTGDNAQIVETYSYKAYGQPTIKDRTGAVFDKSLAWNPYLFTARELDSESGLYYYRARYYDWQRGAFTQEDPIGFHGSKINMYQYANASPFKFIDPSGEKVTITITRTTLEDDSIISVLSVVSDLVPNTFSGYTLEPIRKKGSVSTGIYDAFVRTDHSPSRIELKNVPGNENIQIHVGNYPANSAGCFLAGKSKGKSFVGDSGMAIREILGIIEKDASGDISVGIRQSFPFWAKSVWKNFLN